MKFTSKERARKRSNDNINCCHFFIIERFSRNSPTMQKNRYSQYSYAIDFLFDCNCLHWIHIKVSCPSEIKISHTTSVLRAGVRMQSCKLKIKLLGDVWKTWYNQEHINFSRKKKRKTAMRLRHGLQTLYKPQTSLFFKK